MGRFWLSLVGIAALSLFGARLSAQSAAFGVLSVCEEAFKNPDDDLAFNKYASLLPKVGEYYVVEGDLLKTVKELRTYLRVKSVSSISAQITSELVIAKYNGELDYWQAPASRALSYAIDRASFATPEYDDVVRAMTTATGEWAAVCPSCGITFEHKVAFDANPDLNKNQITFIVRKLNSKGAYIATSFYPSTPIERRFLYIDPVFFQSAFTQVGVLRHSLGHILGYRHERLSSPVACYKENEDWKPLSRYVKTSVMRYFCPVYSELDFSRVSISRGQTIEISISDNDKRDHIKLYSLSN